MVFCFPMRIINYSFFHKNIFIIIKQIISMNELDELFHKHDCWGMNELKSYMKSQPCPANDPNASCIFWNKEKKCCESKMYCERY